jgi:16S rRNA (guanine527-N7)-methyltransferase
VPDRPTTSAGERAAAARDLAAALEHLQLDVDASQRAALLALAELLLVWGARINLTGHKTFATIVQGLVIESAALTRELPQIDSLADLGSGAGFPGLPIAILRPDCRVTLVEARERRYHFQKAAIRELGLENAFPLRGRAEVLTPVPHAAAIAQAMAQPERALVWMVPWVREGGRVLIPGSSAPPTIVPQPGVVAEVPAHYRVPGSERERTLWIGRVVG